MHTLSIALTSIGCRTNQEEVTSLGSTLRAKGYHIVKKNADADIIIINSCSVTGGTEAKVKRLIRSLTQRYPLAKVLVTGCLAQQIPEELQQISGVEWVVGNTYKKDIPHILENQHAGLFYSSFRDSAPPVAVFAGPPSDPQVEWRTRFPVKIQEGCDYRCSYCIVPLLRGPSRSVVKSEVIAFCKRAVDRGYKEIVFTGTHIGQYSDGAPYGLVALIDEVLSMAGDFRLRLSSLDPRDCTDELLMRVAEDPRLCEHIHISVQSLSPEVLLGMSRVFEEYDDFIKRMLDFRNRSPHAGIGGDFIVGFPGETEKMFAATLQTVKHLGFNYGHVFRYSKRPGTAAETMGNQIREKEKTERSNRLRSLLGTMRTRFVQRQLTGIEHTIIIEKEKPVRGITPNYIRVVVPGSRGVRNTWQKVRLVTYVPEKNYCEAECCEEE